MTGNKRRLADRANSWLISMSRLSPWWRIPYALLSMLATIALAVMGMWVASIVVAYTITLFSLLHERGTHLGSSVAFMRTLSELARSSNKAAAFSSYVVLYTVDMDGKDSHSRVMSIATDSHEAIFIQNLAFGADPAAAPRLRDFASLDVQAKSSNGEAFVLPTSYDDAANVWEAELLLARPLRDGESHRQVAISSNWPGLWNSLRDNGNDAGFFHMGLPTKHLEISFDFPPAIRQEKDVDLLPIDPRGVGRVVKRITEDNRIRVTWLIDDAQPGTTYRYALVCENLPALLSGRREPLVKILKDWLSRL